ncbi:MAG: hypothetical protein ACKOPS_15525, partial [Cyanobium sp.]
MVLLFGAGGALGSAIASHLAAQGFAIHTAGTTRWEGASTHLPLTYDKACQADDFSAIPELD